MDAGNPFAYARVALAPEGDHRYFASTAVFLNEVLKLAISLSFAVYDVSRPAEPRFVQVLATTNGPEGILPVPLAR